MKLVQVNPVSLVIQLRLKNKRVSFHLNFHSYFFSYKNDYFIIIEVPEAPEAPKPDRITKDSVVLSWRPSRFDGGGKIKEYILEQKKKDESDWSEVVCPTIYSTLCTVIHIFIYF